MNRARFIELFFTAAAGVYFTRCSNHKNNYSVTMANDDSGAGHLLLQPHQNVAISNTNTVDILIIGAGISGLSAGRWLLQHSKLSFKIQELSSSVGGNSVSGENKVSRYPWAAHYLPIPQESNTELIDFLKEINVVTGYVKNLPIYNEAYICFDPKERLYINGVWQEGIIPNANLDNKSRAELSRFHKYIDSIKDKKDALGKYIFDIPISNASTNNEFIELDKISFKQWLMDNDYHSEAIQWYTNYSTSDDYGAPIENTSAWAGLHYFAARRGFGANTKLHEVLTWPEGNDFLAKQMETQLLGKIKTNTVAISIDNVNGRWETLHYNTTQKNYEKTIASKIIFAAPIRVLNKLNNKLFNNSNFAKTCTHYPWIVANITIKKPIDGNGIEQCWDNVIYRSKSLGYVVASHQNLDSVQQKQVITFYRPMNDSAAIDERKKLRNATLQDFRKIIITDLKTAHPNIEEFIEAMEIKILGHGMIAPTPNFLFGSEKQIFEKNLPHNFAIAHTDIVGISIFEEAFYQGIAAAKTMI